MNLPAVARSVDNIVSATRNESRVVLRATKLPATIHSLAIAGRTVSIVNELLRVSSRLRTSIINFAPVLEESLSSDWLMSHQDNQDHDFIEAARKISELEQSLLQRQPGVVAAALRQLAPVAAQTSSDSARLICRLAEKVDASERATQAHLLPLIKTIQLLRRLIELSIMKPDEVRTAQVLVGHSADTTFDFVAERRDVVARYPNVLARLGE